MISLQNFSAVHTSGSELFLATQTVNRPHYWCPVSRGFSHGHLAASDWLSDSG